MSSNYKNNLDSTRAALFAPSNPSGKQQATKAKSATVRSAPAAVRDQATTSSAVRTQRSGKSNFRTSLSPEQKVAKMNEAEGFRKQAKKAMSSGLFSSPDPVSASTYYKKAADLYKVCQEPKLEMLLRISTAELINDRLAAVEYKRAADLAIEVEGYGVEKAAHYNLNAAQLFLESGDNAKAAEATTKAGLVYIDPTTNNALTGYETECVTNLEKAVNLYVPFCLNPRASSASILEAGDDDALNQDAAEHLVVTSAYGGKNLTQIMFHFILMGEMGSALYAAGAATFLYEKDSISTISLHRSYLAETVLLLAQGDAVAANEAMMRHFQKTSYLRSRECELEENLVRAIQSCDEEALTKAQMSPVLNNLERCLIDLVLRLRVIGTAKKIERDNRDHEEDEADAEATFQEMGDLMAEMGLDGDNDDEDDFDLT